MTRNETKRVMAEAKRQAKITTTSAAAGSGPQAPGALSAGEVVDGEYVPYGRVGITDITQGFLPRQD